MTGERDQRGEPSGEPHEPSPLPPELAEFLRNKDIACLMQGTDQGTAFVIKLASRDIESARGTVPIHLRHELYAHPTAPVIRTNLRIYDQPNTSLALETFTNIEDLMLKKHRIEGSQRDSNGLRTHIYMQKQDNTNTLITSIVVDVNPADC